MTTAAHILLSFSMRGVVLSSHRGRLRIDAPHGELTPEDREVLAEHKSELLIVLAAPPIDFDAADLPIDEWEDEPPATTPPADDPAKLCRCGSIEWRDTTLKHPPHNGRSVRRDCAKCGRTIDFPVWVEEE